MNELKPCPFCGGQVKLKMEDIAIIQCTKCNAIISFGGNEYPKQTVMEIILDNIKRCQYAIKSFLSGNGSKQSRLPQILIYPFPYIDEEGEDV